MGTSNNQNFVLIPTGRLIKRLQELTTEYGIVVTLTEEANTSAASYLDGDTLPAHGEKPKGWRASGKRVQRGLYRSAQGRLINADCNAAANILKKVMIQLELNLAEVGWGALTLPRRVDLFSALSKSYRKKCGVGVLLAPVATSA
jgi:transposase